MDQVQVRIGAAAPTDHRHNAEARELPVRDQPAFGRMPRRGRLPREAARPAAGGVGRPGLEPRTGGLRVQAASSWRRVA